MLDNFKTQHVIWDYANTEIFKKIAANSGDQYGRKLKVSITNGGVIENLTSAIVTLAWTTLDRENYGFDNFEAVDPSKGVFELHYSDSMLTNVGKLYASIIIYVGGHKVESMPFTIDVLKSTLQEGAIEGENSFTALTEALVEVQNIEQKFADIREDIEDNKKWNRQWLNGEDFGMRGGFDTEDAYDNGAALKAVFDYIYNDPYYDHAKFGANRRSKYNIEIPKGIYIFKSGDIGNTGTLESGGIRIANTIIKGNGSIFYVEDFEGNLFHLDDRFMWLDFHDITFQSKNDDMERNLMYSYSYGGVQQMRFHQCSFFGKWKHGVILEGNDNNSEWTWNDCNLSGNWDSFLHCPADKGSDQSLNYWFNRCKIWGGSTFIHLEKGGHVKLNECDFSMRNPSEETYIFKLGNQYGEGGFGVQTFIDRGGRYELLSGNLKVIKSKWAQAQIIFDGSDFSSSTHFGGQDRRRTFDFETHWSTRRHFILFDNCKLLGMFHLKNRNADNTDLRIRNCSWYNSEGSEQHPTVDTFFEFDSELNHLPYRVILENVRYRGQRISKTLRNRELKSVDFQTLMWKRNTGNQNTIPNLWSFPISGQTIVKSVTIFGRSTVNGHWSDISVRSNVATVTGLAPYPDGIVVSDTDCLLIGDKISATSDKGKVYTITEILADSNVVYLSEDFTGSVGNTIALSLVEENGFNSWHGARVITSDTMHKVKSDLYLFHSTTGNNNDSFPFEIYVETIE